MVIDSNNNDGCCYQLILCIAMMPVTVDRDDEYDFQTIKYIENMMMTSNEKVNAIEIDNCQNERLSTIKSMMLRVIDGDDNNCYYKLIL